MSECAYAYHVGMEKVGYCPKGQCVYAGVVLLAGDPMHYVGNFVSEQNALDYAKTNGYIGFSIQPVVMK